LLLDQQGAGRVQRQRALLFQALHRHELHLRAARGLAQRRGVGRVVLAALLHERADGLGRDQLHRVAEAGQHTPPVVRGPARLQHHGARGLRLEEPDQLAPAQLAPDFGLSGLVHAVHVEHGLGGVQPDHGNAHRGRSLLR